MQESSSSHELDVPTRIFIVVGLLSVSGALCFLLIQGINWFMDKGPGRNDSKQYLETVNRSLERARGKKNSAKEWVSALNAAASDIENIPTTKVEIEVVSWGRENAALLRRTANALDGLWGPDEQAFNALRPEMEALEREGERLMAKYGKK
jgi:hypothetical protein